MTAVINGHLDIVKTLFEAGANVNQTDKVGICALLLYSISAHTVVPNVPKLYSCKFHSAIILHILMWLGLMYLLRQFVQLLI